MSEINKRILGMGAAGYVGSHACKAIARDGDPPCLVASNARARVKLGC